MDKIHKIMAGELHIANIKRYGSTRWQWQLVNWNENHWRGAADSKKEAVEYIERDLRDEEKICKINLRFCTEKLLAVETYGASVKS